MSLAEDAPVKASPEAGKFAASAMLIDMSWLVTAHYSGVPDASEPDQRVAFGPSVHRGSSSADKVNERHVLANTQALCAHRTQQGIDNPLSLGIDAHALSVPAGVCALDPFVVRPSGTDDIYKTHAGSIRGADHLHRIQQEALAIVGDALASPSQKSATTSNTRWKKHP